MNHNLGLLEYLRYELGCMFLSDLHSRSILPAIQGKIMKMNLTEFSLSEWKDAVEYITGTQEKFETIEQAVHYLITYTE